MGKQSRSKGAPRAVNTPSTLLVFNAAILLVAVLLLAILAYWNSFHVPLVFDDSQTILRNSAVRLGQFSWNPFSGRSLLYLTFTLNYVLGAQEVWGYHLVNLLLHLFDGTLVFLIARRVFQNTGVSDSRREWFAAAAAAFFLLHPVQTESVTYISSRSELLSTAFYLLAVLIFVRVRKERIGFGLSLVVGLLFVLGLSAKETVISLPAVLLMYDVIVLSQGEVREALSRWRFYLPFAAGAVASGHYLITGTLHQTVGPGLPMNLPRSQYFFTELRVLARYIGLIFAPIGQNLDYDFRPSNTFLDPSVVVAGMALLALLAIGWKIRKHHPVYAYSVFWFFITLAPTSSFVPIEDVIFEHRLYLPLAGICLSFPLLMETVLERFHKSQREAKAPVVAAALILGVLTILTVVRNEVWADDVTLFRDVVAKSPHKDRAYNTLADAYFKRGDYNAAISTFRLALDQVPDHRKDFAESLGNIYLTAGQCSNAIDLFSQTIALNTDTRRVAIANNNLGAGYLCQWQDLAKHVSDLTPERFESEKVRILPAAVQAFSKCLELDPDTPSAARDGYLNAVYLSGSSLQDLAALANGQIVASDLKPIESVERKALDQLAIRQNDFSALYTIARIAVLKGDWARADNYFEKAEGVRQDVRAVYFMHAFALESRAQHARAVEKYLEALRIDPVYIDAHNNVALIYLGLDDLSAAAEHFTEVLRYNPLHVSANIGLARVYSKQGNKEAARHCLTVLLNGSSEDAEVKQVWSELGL